VQDSPQLSESVDSPLLATVDLVGLRGPEVLLLELATSEESSELAEWTTASRLPAAASAIRAARRTSDSAAALEIDCVIALVGIGAARSLRSFAAREGVRIAEIPTDAIATIVSTETPQKLAELSERYLGLRPLAVARDEGQVA
jgi:hypothetical protein